MANDFRYGFPFLAPWEMNVNSEYLKRISCARPVAEGPPIRRAKSRRSLKWRVLVPWTITAILLSYFFCSLAFRFVKGGNNFPLSVTERHVKTQGRVEGSSQSLGKTGRPYPVNSAASASIVRADLEKWPTPDPKSDHPLTQRAGPSDSQVLERIGKAVKEKRWNAAAQEARLLVEKNGTITDHRLYGFLLINGGDYKRGIAELEKLVKIGEADAEVFHRLGHAYSTQRFHEKAFDSFVTAIRLEPRNPRHYKCGATLILKACERGSDRFRTRLSLARKWCDEALRLGALPRELAEVSNQLARYDGRF